MAEHKVWIAERVPLIWAFYGFSTVILKYVIFHCCRWLIGGKIDQISVDDGIYGSAVTRKKKISRTTQHGTWRKRFALVKDDQRETVETDLRNLFHLDSEITLSKEIHRAFRRHVFHSL